MTKPQRIKLVRNQKGWRLQEHSRALNGLPARAVTRPGKWGNPHRVGKALHECATRQMAVDKFRLGFDDIARLGWTDSPIGRMARDMHELRGHNLACHCPLDQPCHADVLLELANAEPPQ